MHHANRQDLEPHAAPARTASAVPLGRVLAVACLVPILAMIVLGASRFDSIQALGVDAPDSTLVTDTADPQDSQDQTLFRLAPVSDSALASAELESAPAEMPTATAMMRVVETRMMVVTAYCPCEKCCGKHARGVTASGKPVTYNGGRFVAADTGRLPFGSMIAIPNYHGGEVVEVIDRGGAIKGDKIDVFFPSHEAARQWGRQRLPVQILEPVELSEAVPAGPDR